MKKNENDLTYRLVAELGLLSALLIGVTITLARAPDSKFEVPFVVQGCSRDHTHLNYNDKNTWCLVQQVSYR